MVQSVNDAVGGVEVVKAFGQESQELERVVTASGSIYAEQMRVVRLQARYQPLLQAIPAVGQAVILGLGGWLALRHEISLGTFLAAMTYVAMLISPVQYLVSAITLSQQAKASSERIFEFLDIQPKIGDTADAVEVPRIRGDITFSDVEFAYGEGPPVLRDFNLHIPAGSRVALGRDGPFGPGQPGQR